MKFYDKSKLHMDNGLIVTKKGKVLNVDTRIVAMANELETRLQEHRYLKAQPEATPMPSLDGFERKSERKQYVMAIETPALDAKTAASLDLMSELDAVSAAAKANDMAEQFAQLVEFAERDSILGVSGIVKRFDTPLLGSPLEYTKDQILDAIAEICGVEHHDEQE